MDQFLMGAAAIASFVVGVFFLRYWRDTADRLFVIFGTAFFILGGTRVALALSISKDEDHTYLYWLRLLAFALILVAIIDKNRPRRSQPMDHAGSSAPFPDTAQHHG